jgi:hypothetical protein
LLLLFVEKCFMGRKSKRRRQNSSVSSPHANMSNTPPPSMSNLTYANLVNLDCISFSIVCKLNTISWFVVIVCVFMCPWPCPFTSMCGAFDCAKVLCHANMSNTPPPSMSNLTYAVQNANETLYGPPHVIPPMFTNVSPTNSNMQMQLGPQMQTSTPIHSTFAQSNAPHILFFCG